MIRIIVTRTLVLNWGVLPAGTPFRSPLLNKGIFDFATGGSVPWVKYFQKKWIRGCISLKVKIKFFQFSLKKSVLHLTKFIKYFYHCIGVQFTVLQKLSPCFFNITLERSVYHRKKRIGCSTSLFNFKDLKIMRISMKINL